MRTHFRFIKVVFGLYYAALQTILAGHIEEDRLGAYDVVWKAPSENASESMPCGGGDIGLNVWAPRLGELIQD